MTARLRGWCSAPVTKLRSILSSVKGTCESWAIEE